MANGCDQGCEICAGNEDNQKKITRAAIMAMIADIAENPDLAKQLWVTLKLAAGETR